MDYESIGVPKTNTYHLQSKFNLVLLADDNLKPRLSVGRLVEIFLWVNVGQMSTT